MFWSTDTESEQTPLTSAAYSSRSYPGCMRWNSEVSLHPHLLPLSIWDGHCTGHHRQLMISGLSLHPGFRYSQGFRTSVSGRNQILIKQVDSLYTHPPGFLLDSRHGIPIYPQVLTMKLYTIIRNLRRQALLVTAFPCLV